MKVISNFVDKPHRKTCKRSKKRNVILSCIHNTGQHPSDEWIYDQLKLKLLDLSRGPVYRNLRLFLEESTVLSVDVVDGLECFDCVVMPHTHFICRRCGEVLDFPELILLQSVKGTVRGYDRRTGRRLYAHPF